MGLGNFTQLMIQQMDSPECSVLAGMQFGQIWSFRFMFIAFGIFMLFHYLAKIIDWIIKKIKLKLQKKS